MTKNANEQSRVDAAVAAERIALCDVLEDLRSDEWRAASLCDRWSVREVVAHLTLATEETVRGMISGMIKARGNWERMNAEQAISHARQHAPSTLIEQLRASARSTRRAPMSNPVDPLVDILVHAQDITRPLGREHRMDPERVKPALAYAVESRWYGGRKRFDGVTLAASDDSWTFGTGDEQVVGDVGDLLLMAAGRGSGLDALAGPGVATLRARIAPQK